MDAWPTNNPPTLPGRGDTLRLYDTSTGTLVPTPAGSADSGSPARIYVCGITPYDATHIGHAATYTAFDLVQRVWRDAGHEQVRYVQNVTDVDDPLLERANKNGADWQVLALRETALFREDMTALRILPPYRYIGAVEAIPLVVELVERLLESGAAYHVDEDIYFDVHSDSEFGAELFGEPPGHRLSFRIGVDRSRPAQQEGAVQMPHHRGAGNYRQRLSQGSVGRRDDTESEPGPARHSPQSNKARVIPTDSSGRRNHRWR